MHGIVRGKIAGDVFKEVESFLNSLQSDQSTPDNIS